MAVQRVVVSFDEVSQNIRRYNFELSSRPQLAARIKQHPAWYAIKNEDGGWIFGPSKFIGYFGANAQEYLSSYSRKDGRDTEPALRQWFEQVDAGTALGRELKDSFIAFAGSHGKTPNANWRVSLPHHITNGAGEARQDKQKVDGRIAFDPGICGGRARIAGTRVRVSDIVSLIGEGVERRVILEDFPYLTDADISAALAYAAKSVDHVILSAA